MLTSEGRRTVTPASRGRLAGVAVALVAIAVVVLAIRSSAQPRLRVLDARPGDGAVLTAPPAQVSIGFDGVNRPVEWHISAARTTGGAFLDTDQGAMQGQRLVSGVAIPGDGTYVIAYHLKLADGQEVSGSARFTVDATGTATPPAPAGDTTVVAGHDHGGGDPFSAGLVVVDVLLVIVLVVALLRRPRPQQGKDLS